MLTRRFASIRPALVSLCAALLFFSSCRTNDNGPGDGNTGHFSPQQLQADFTQMRNALESNHPDRFRYETAETLSTLFDSTFASLQHDMSEAEFYRVAAPLVARYHCGHTRITPASSFSPGLVMPLGIYLADGKAYVDADYGSDSSIPLGREVLAINNEPIAAISERLQAGISADALNRSIKVHQLNREFYRYYYYFWGETPGFDLLLKDPANGSESTLRVAAKPYAQVSRQVNARFAADSRLAFSITNDRAVLRVPTFVASQNPDYRAFFENSFQQMNERGIALLIIDIRGNGGGDPDVSVALISHLADGPFVYFKKGISYGNLFSATAPHAVHFNGTVHVLIDGGCFSTSGHFCAVMRHQQLAVFIGETGGGTFRCHDNSTEIVLGNTAIRLRVARTTFEAAVPDSDVSAGFPPDHRVIPTINDILSGSDPQLDFAIRLFEEGN